MPLVYAVEDAALIDVDEVIALLHASTLGERRPVDDRERLAAALRHTPLLVTAREDGRLVGYARSLTDYGWATYLADLAVAASHQRRGIGGELVRRTRAAVHPDGTFVLLSAPAAVGFYERQGLHPHPRAFVGTQP
jgi:ribosomal protein S18 acetylase RimI-like enzyme